MKQFLYIIIVILLFFSCKEKIATKEQTELYIQYQEIIKKNNEFIAPMSKGSDSIKNIIMDIKDLELEELIRKHNIQKTEINDLLSSMNVTVKILELTKQIKESDSLLKRNKKLLNELNDFSPCSNLMLKKINISDIDTSKVKVDVRNYTYDSTKK